MTFLSRFNEIKLGNVDTHPDRVASSLSLRFIVVSAAIDEKSAGIVVKLLLCKSTSSMFVSVNKIPGTLVNPADDQSKRVATGEPSTCKRLRRGSRATSGLSRTRSGLLRAFSSTRLTKRAISSPISSRSRPSRSSRSTVSKLQDVGSKKPSRKNTRCDPGTPCHSGPAMLEHTLCCCNMRTTVDMARPTDRKIMTNAYPYRMTFVASHTAASSLVGNSRSDGT
mmetsp:Transcript_27040/g.93846  ORF Transcript_27040/g.93846 Transcript_27040/m.93846 type:complete len:224 (-) Transcript_27040:454-1125(-)